MSPRAMTKAKLRSTRSRAATNAGSTGTQNDTPETRDHDHGARTEPALGRERTVVPIGRAGRHSAVDVRCVCSVRVTGTRIGSYGRVNVHVHIV